VEKENPDYLFMIGDNIYTHGKKRDSFNKMREKYLSFRKEPGFVSLVKNRPTLAVWDDHDMGPNDSDGTLEGKEQSLNSFMDVWPNPSYGIEKVPDVFFSKRKRVISTSSKNMTLLSSCSSIASDARYSFFSRCRHYC